MHQSNPYLDRLCSSIEHPPHVIHDLPREIAAIIGVYPGIVATVLCGDLRVFGDQLAELP